jgi:hypothetical protein
MRVGAIGIAAVLLLSGCSLLPRIPVLNDGGSSSDGNGTGNGDDVENNPFLDHDVPDGFPAEVPLPNLDIYFSLRSTEESWSIIYKANDLESDFNSIVDSFEGAGWEVLMNNAAADGSLGVFKKDPYQVQVMGVADGGNDYDGPILSFTVVATS